MRSWVASLPMYDLPEIRPSLDRLWGIIARHCRCQGLSDIPEMLVRERPVHELWADESLLFSQCCGYDIVYRYKHQLSVLGTPIYSAPGCDGSDYASLIVVPENSRYRDILDMRGTVAVVNGSESQSGANSLFGLVTPERSEESFFTRIIVSGSHVASLDVLRRRQADVAAIDCVTHALIQTYRPQALVGTKVLGLTYSAPAPPFVTRAALPDDQKEHLRTALFSAFADTEFKTIAASIMLTGVADYQLVDYGRIATSFVAAP